MMIVNNKVLKSSLVDWRKLIPFQSLHLTEMTVREANKLKKSLLENSSVDAFKVWENEGEIYILDGHKRQKILLDLESQGVVVPQKLPADFINCKSESEAAKLVLVYRSQYAETTEEGLYHHIVQFDLNPEIMLTELDIPGINPDRFLDHYFVDTPLREPQFSNNMVEFNTGGMSKCPLCGSERKGSDYE